MAFLETDPNTFCGKLDLSVPPFAKYAIAHSGFKNLDHDEPNTIANAVTKIGKIFQQKSSAFNITLTDFLPRD